MKDLEDAWKWYQETKRLITMIRRLSDRYWDDLPWESRLNRDDRFSLADAPKIVEGANYSLAHLDDLAIVVLFSVFEAEVRNSLGEEVKIEAAGLRHALLQKSGQQLLETIETGSFFKILDGYKKLNADLVEQVNQVRSYRNWVAHGKKKNQPAHVEPTVAYERLTQFLKAIMPTEDDPGSNEAPPS